MSVVQTLAALPAADLDLLATLVEYEKCALVLGPFANTDVKGVPLRQLLANEIAQKFREESGSVLPEPDNLAMVSTAFLQMPDTPRLSLEIMVRDFYKRHNDPSAILQEAARLPFPVVFTTSPDLLLQKAFLSEKKRQFCEGVYRIATKQIDDYHETPPGQTYFYQLFGRVTDAGCDATILSTDDQLRYIDSIQGVGDETRLPKSLRNAMKSFEAFLFVGFDYENWYLRVLFHILEISASDRTKLIFGLPDGISKNLSLSSEAFFRQQYRFKFLKDKPLDLLQSIRKKIEERQQDRDSQPVENNPARSLLFLHAEADRPTMEKLDRQLAQVKRQHGLVSKSIHDFQTGDDATVKANLVDAASVIIPIISADLLSDDILFGNLTKRALARQSASVCVASVYARECNGVPELFQQQVVLPAHAVPLTWMAEDVGLAKASEQLEKLIAVLQ